MNPLATGAFRAILVLILLGLAAWGLHALYDWPYQNGVMAERAKWEKAASAAQAKQQAADAASTLTAESVADETRQRASEAATAVSSDTAATREAINHAYRQDPPTARPCGDDGRPAPIPASVQRRLDEARTAAEAAATAG